MTLSRNFVVVVAVMLFKERDLSIFINCFGRSQWREAETLGEREVSSNRIAIWS